MMSADQKGLFVLMLYTLVPVLPVAAQQSSSGPLWQGSRTQQSVITTSPSQEPPLSPVPQRSLSPAPQTNGEGHPQVMEMPAVQLPSPPPSQSVPSPQPSAAVARSASLPARPAYLGVVGRTAPTCRYPAGVRISQVIAGSPADQAGLKGEATLSWQQAMTGLLALSPVAPLVLPFLATSPHGGRGDLILAVDGKRIHNREEFEQEMQRFRPGDVVYFSVLRGEGSLSQIPVYLTDSPSATSTVRQTSGTQPAPGS